MPPRVRPFDQWITLVADGHPDLLQALRSILLDPPAVAIPLHDPPGMPDAHKALSRALWYLEDAEILGPLAWKLYAEICGGDALVFLRVLLAVNFGALSTAGLRIGVQESLLDVDGLVRFSLRNEARLSAPRVPSGVMPTIRMASQDEFFGVLNRFFGTPPASADNDEES